ncbi:hypothetical protein M409DRAFT_22980 [Zasmidium cellare ATCC 36951]|uniref:Uncharacterized protein n=1 Tax=Zasmidium cellare ATCC 36951 TaxID=1080233 RepID=A0A6A6CL52_ZASCE|nr:uncharacterized protein M409DRAFT_22980 [Zasmidium cellare ATCC 36951]KAF2166928.1 hypothetical protein M409DRAFT_22980 [Zasmidium cellare ATCC 36951]
MASGLLSHSPLLLKTATALSLFPLSLGLIGTLSPSSGYKIFSIPPPTQNAEAYSLGTHLFLFWASRDLFMAAAINIAAWNGDRRTLGMVYLAMCGVGAFDAWTCERVVGKGKWAHLGFLPLLVGVGGGLLGWFDGW